jgi:hypothetical protein
VQKYLTVMEASRPEHIGRSPAWIRKAIELGKIQAEKYNNIYLLTKHEVERVKENPFTISRQEMYGVGGTHGTNFKRF